MKLIVIIIPFLLLSCDDKTIDYSEKESGNTPKRNFDTTGLTNSVIHYLDDMYKYSYEELVQLYLLNENTSEDSLKSNESVAIDEKIYEKYIENRTLSRDTMLATLTKDYIHNFKLIKRTKDSLNQKSPHIISANTKSTLYNCDLKLRKDNSFDILYTYSFALNLEIEIYHGYYERKVDTVELFFKSKKPYFIDKKYIIDRDLKPYSSNEEVFRDFQIIDEIR